MNNQEPNQEKIPATDLCFQAANTLGELPFNSHAGVGLAVASFILGLVSLPLSLFLNWTYIRHSRFCVWYCSSW